MNRVLVAVAGAGKTHRIASEIAESGHKGRVLVLTYTVRNQLEDASRIARAGENGANQPRVMGWMTFLLNEVIRPYLPLKYPDVELRGLGIDPPTFQHLKGCRRYFNRDGDAYPGTLAKLANDVVKASRNAPIKRLELLYDAIYIDEAQDLRGNDLEIIAALFKSEIDITVVLDPRQAVLSTTKHDTKNKPYRGVKVLGFYRNLEDRNLCTVEDLNETHRFVPEIAAFSDFVIDDLGNFPKTVSHVTGEGEHQGIFIIPKDCVREYAEQHGATILRWNKSSGNYPGLPVANFGECKGMQCDHVVVIATTSFVDFLVKGVSLPEESACKFYVAVTRAKYSVAIAVDDAESVFAAISHSSSALYDMCNTGACRLVTLS